MYKIDALQGARSTEAERILIREDSSTTATSRGAILTVLKHSLWWP